MIKHIFCDMDGTLLTTQGKLSPKTIQTIKKTALPFTLVSARAPMEMTFAIETLELRAPQIAFNGGLIFQGHQVLEAHPINYFIAKFLLTYLQQHFPQLSLSYYTQKHWYSAEIDAGIRLEQHFTGKSPYLTRVDAFTRSFHQVFKIMLILFDAPLLQHVKATLEALPIQGVSIQQSGQNYLEITSNQAKKSRGLQFLAAQNQLERTEIAALGDGHNDLPMFAYAGCTIVMENAVPEVKTAAQFISRSNDHDGVAYALKHFVTV